MGFFRPGDWGRRGLVAFGVPFLKTWLSTCRTRILTPDLHQAFFSKPRSSIGATWHRGGIFFSYFYGPFHPMVLFSQSQDGEYLAQFAKRCGMIPVRGSTTRGGERALLKMIKHLAQEGHRCSTVVDGPQGPRYVAQKGLLVLAKKTGVPILPGIWSSKHVLTLEKTWDKTMIPLPFSEILIAYGNPLNIPRETTEDELEGFRRQLQDVLNDLMFQVDKASGYQTRL
jgi:hypothetical protein